MRAPTWRIDAEAGEPDLDGPSRAVLVTGRHLAGALRRTWPIWCGAVLVGALLGLGGTHLLPRPVDATVTLLMVSPNPDDPSAMSTDVSLLETRAVAARVVEDLEVSETPDQFLSTVTTTAVSSQVLKVTVSGSDAPDASARVTALVESFLAFRSEQLRSISDGLVAGYTKRLGLLQAEIADLTREYGRLSAQKAPDQVLITEIVGRRAALGAEVTELQRSIESAHLRTDAAVSATHVLDSAGAKPPRSRRQLVIAPAAGAILGGALGMGTILFRTLTSDRLRRRGDVALALGVPVRVSVGRVRPSRRWLPHRGSVVQPAHARRKVSVDHRSRRLETLVLGLSVALPPRQGGPAPVARGAGQGPRRRRTGPATLGVVAIDRDDIAAEVLCLLAGGLAGDGVRVLLVDLSASGALARRAATGGPVAATVATGDTELFRPANPTLAVGPRQVSRLREHQPAERQELRELWGNAEVVLVLLEVEPGTDLDIVATWVDRVVPLVSVGCASHDLLATVAALLGASGVVIPWALLEGADRDDVTLGHPDDVGAVTVPVKAVHSS